MQRLLNRSLGHVYASGRQALNKSACRKLNLWHIIIRHCLRVALIQVKLTVDFLLLHAQLAQAFLMLEGR